MSAISDLILQQVKSATGGINIPAAVKNQAVSGLSDSILGSLTQTVAKPGGLDLVKGLLTGKSNAATSPVTALAGKLFANNIASKLGLNTATTGALTGLIPNIFSKVSGFVKDQDGDGDVDINDILITLKGGNSNAGSGILGAAAGILGSFLKK